MFWNGKLTGYQVCYSETPGPANNPQCTAETKLLQYTIRNLKPSTKYVVSIAAGTSAGFGTKKEINKITNGGNHPVTVRQCLLSDIISKETRWRTVNLWQYYFRPNLKIILPFSEFFKSTMASDKIFTLSINAGWNNTLPTIGDQRGSGLICQITHPTKSVIHYSMFKYVACWSN